MAITIGNITVNDPVWLAPMTGVSDLPFRKLVKRFGAGMVVSEMIASRAMILETKNTLRMASFSPDEYPFAVQLAGCDPEVMADAAKLNEDRGAHIIDINFGCPVKKVVCKGAGAGVLKDVDLMIRLTKAVIKSTNLPVTVKTRLGWDDSMINIMEVAERLQDIGIKALTVHGRTRAQMYKGEARWEYIAEVKNNPRMHIPIFGNGDINSPEKALVYKNKYGLDGMMIGRAAIGYPWIFNEIKHFFKTGEHLPTPSIANRVEVCKTHVLKSVEWKGEKLGLLEMRNHYANYFKGIPDFKETRTKLVTLNTTESIVEVLAEVSARPLLQTA